jgi:hypothetical protein
LLDEKTIVAVVPAYAMAEENSAKPLLLGGRPGVAPEKFRRYVVLPSSRVTQVAQVNNVTAVVIQQALDHLGTTRPWREMTWRERWRWLRTPA